MLGPVRPCRPSALIQPSPALNIRLTDHPATLDDEGDILRAGRARPGAAVSSPRQTLTSHAGMQWWSRTRRTWAASG